MFERIFLLRNYKQLTITRFFKQKIYFTSILNILIFITLSLKEKLSQTFTLNNFIAAS